MRAPIPTHRGPVGAELAIAKDSHTRALAAWKEVEALQPPPAELEEEFESEYGRRPRQVWRMGGARVWTFGEFDAERRQALLNSWCSDRYKERGFTLPPYSYKQKVDDLVDRLAKIERKLATLMF